VRVDHGDRAPLGYVVRERSPADARVGALVIHTPPRLDRAAIEIHAVGAPWTGVTALVREQKVAERGRFEGVFPRLEVGLYELRILGARSGVVVPVAITEGAVAETWLDAPVD